jgi:gas vesicle protein
VKTLNQINSFGGAVLGGAVVGGVIVAAGAQPNGREAETRTVKNKINSFLICFPPTQKLDKFSVLCCL